MRNPTGQALVRQLSRDEVRERVPDDLSDCIFIEDYEDALLVRAIDKPEAIALLQQICDEDCDRMCALQREQFPDEFPDR